MKQKINYYKPILGEVVPIYLFIEGDDKEKFFVDSQTCDYELYKKLDKETLLIDGNNWWIMWPHVYKNTKNNTISTKKIKWFVDASSRTEDIDKEWDFKNHKVIELI